MRRSVKRNALSLNETGDLIDATAPDFVDTRWHITDGRRMFFRWDLDSTLQPMNSILPDEIVPPTAGSLRHVEDQAKSPTGLGQAKSFRTVGDLRPARPSGADGDVAIHPFSGFFKVPVGRILLFLTRPRKPRRSHRSRQSNSLCFDRFVQLIRHYRPIPSERLNEESTR